MPELASPIGYKLPQIRYEPPKTPTFEATQIVPDLRGAAALQGSAASLNLVAQTIAQLPELVTKSLAAGRKESEQKQVHSIKLDALAGRQTPAQMRALEGFSFGADDSLAYKPTDPVLAQLKQDYQVAQIGKANALADRARNGAPAKPTLYDTLTGAAPTGRAALSSSNAGAVSADELPLPEEPALPADPALGAVAPVAPPAGPALAGFGAGPATGPVPEQAAPLDVLPPLNPGSAAAPLGRAALAGTQEEAAPVEDGVVMPKYDGDTVKRFAGGKLVAEVYPGENHWRPVTAKNPPNDPLETAEGTELIKRGFPVEEIRTMTPERKSEILKTPKAAAPTAMQYRQALEWGVDIAGMTRDEVATAVHQKQEATQSLPPVIQKGFTDLRKEMAQNPVIKQAGVQNKGFQNILAGYEQHNGAGDMMMIDGFARLINPSMGVTGQMVTNFKEALPLMEKWFQLPFDKFSDGAKLTEEGRKMFLVAAKAAHEGEMEKVREAIRGYGEIAATKGVPRDMVERAGMTAYLITDEKKSETEAGNGQPAQGGYIPGKKYQGKTYLGGDPTDDVNWK